MDLKNIKTLRDETGAGILEIKQTLEKFNGSYEKAKEELMKKVADKAAKKADRNAADGLIYSYIHNNGKIGSMVYIACETDFVAKTDQFKQLCHEVAMQVCSGDYKDVKDLIEDDYIKDGSKKITDLVNEAIAKVGEKIEIVKFVKYSIGD